MADEIGPRVHQVAAGNGHQSGRAFAAPAVELLQPPVLVVVENLAPHRLGRADAHRIGMLGGLVGQARRMQPAEHDLRPAALPPLGQFIGPAGRRDVRLDADQIHVPVDLGGFDVLVAHRDVPAIRRESGDRQQAQRGKLGILDQPEVLVARPLNGGENQQQSAFHGSLLQSTLHYKVKAQKKDAREHATLTRSRPWLVSSVDDLPQCLQVSLEGLAALGRQTHGRVRAAPLKGLVDDDVARFLEGSRVRAEVAVGQVQHGLQLVETQFGRYGQSRHDGQPHALVDHRVDVVGFDGLAHEITVCRCLRRI